MKRYEITSKMFDGPLSRVCLTTQSGRTIAVLAAPVVLESDQELVVQAVRSASPFVDPCEVARETLAATDEPLVRVLEDLIGVLVSKGTIRLADLPQSARDKLAQRQQLRLALSAAESARGETPPVGEGSQLA
jgi:hypothetical protein